MDWHYIILHHVCPSMMVVLSTLMFGAPMKDLSHAMIEGSLGDLNPFPWALQTGNCFGWVAYAWYTGDPYMLASNLPGFLFSLWLNLGACKLQYRLEWEDQLGQNQTRKQRRGEGTDDASSSSSSSSSVSSNHPKRQSNNHHHHPRRRRSNEIVMVAQERRLFAVIVFWVAVLVYIQWIAKHIMYDDTTTTTTTDASNPTNGMSTMHTQKTVTLLGLINNICLMLYYGAPLQALAKVVQQASSASIHRPTMLLSWANTSLWILFGVVRQDVYIIFPNVIGLLLGLAQGVLCLKYPLPSSSSERERERPAVKDTSSSSSERGMIAMEATHLLP